MSDFTQREEPMTIPAGDVPFAPTPVYARQGKSRRKMGARPAPAKSEYETSSFAPGAAESADSDTTFILPERDVRPGRSVPMAALLAIPAAIVLAGGAYFLMQPREAQPESVAMATPAPGPLAVTSPAEVGLPSPQLIVTL